MPYAWGTFVERKIGATACPYLIVVSAPAKSLLGTTTHLGSTWPSNPLYMRPFTSCNVWVQHTTWRAETPFRVREAWVIASSIRRNVAHLRALSARDRAIVLDTVD